MSCSKLITILWQKQIMEVPSLFLSLLILCYLLNISKVAMGFEPDKSAKVEPSTTLNLSTQNIWDLAKIAEQLRLQEEVERRLHGQLSSQRTLQLRFEEQGRYLRMVYEKHAKLKVSSSIPDSPLVLYLSHFEDKSAGPDYSEGKALVKDNAEKNDTNQANVALGESSSKLGEKGKDSLKVGGKGKGVSDAKPLGNREPDFVNMSHTQPAKLFQYMMILSSTLRE